MFSAVVAVDWETVAGLEIANWFDQIVVAGAGLQEREQISARPVGSVDLQ